MESAADVRCSGGCIGLDIPVELKEILPADYVHHLCTLQEIQSPSSSNYCFNATLRLQTKNEKEVKEWLEAFQVSSSCTWRVLQTYTVTGRYINFKKGYRCHHNTRPEKHDTNKNRKKQSKNTNCPTKFTVTVRNSVTSKNKLSRSATDKHLPDFPTTVTLVYQHNHNTMCADALKYRDVSSETMEKLIDLFHKKHGPTAALDMLKYDLQLEHGKDYYKVAADRAVCPDIGYCSRLYNKTFLENYGKSNGEDMLASLHEYAEHYNTEHQTKAIAVEVLPDQQVVVAICTPLMQRVHTLLKHSGELCFMDASSNMDRHNVSIFLLLTHSCVGGLPVGVLITTSETESTIRAALDLYKSILPPQCFGGRGVNGPQVFITDDCQAERRALNKVFPQSSLVLCVFHVLQATWRWLWNPSHKVPKPDRPNHLAHMKRLIYAQSADDIQSLFEASMNDPTLQQSFKEYLKTYYDRKHEWSIAFRDDLPIRGNNTNNFCESAVRVLKDKVLERTKAYNVPQLADFVSSRLQVYYERRILDVASGRLDNIVTSRYMLNERNISKADVKQITPTEYKVMSKSQPDQEYNVNTLVGHCTCPVGKTGGPCKHQAAVVKFFCASSFNFVPVADPDMRILLYKIATGGDIPSMEWFAGLQPTPSLTPPPTPTPFVPIHHKEQETPGVHMNQDLHAVVDSLQEQARVDNLFEQRKSSQSSSDATLKEEFRRFSEEILTKLDLYPDIFRPAVKAMLAQKKKNISNDTHLCSAMHTFGKYTGAARAFLQKGSAAKRAATRLPQLKGTGSIGVQPTTTARRRPHMGRGGRRLHAGRPCKSSHVPEHGYGQMPRECRAILPLPKRRKVPAPHNLSYSVTYNKSLGRTHSTK